jgi:hypothetical protein
MSGAVPSDKEALRLLQIGPLDAVIADLDMHEVAACQLPTKMRCFPYWRNSVESPPDSAPGMSPVQIDAAAGRSRVVAEQQAKSNG